MKRMMAGLLALGLIMTCIFPVQAAETLPGADRQNARNEMQTDPDSEDQRKQETQTGNGKERTVTDSDAATPSPVGTFSPVPEKSASPSPVPTAISPSPAASAGVNKTPASGASAETDKTPGSGAAEGSPQIEGTPVPSGMPGAAGAEGENLPQSSPTASVAPENASSVNTEDDIQYASSDPAGRIEVLLRNAIPVEKVTATVRVEMAGEGKSGSGTVILEKNAQIHPVHFDQLLPGSYHLTVEAPGFLPYKQDIEVDGNVVTAEIHTGFVDMEGFSCDQDKARPGVLLIGDVNGDGIIDGKDKDAITEAISRGENGVLAGNPDDATDLNRDGRTDLVDLQYYVNSRASQYDHVDTSSSLAESIAPDAIAVNIDQDITVTGGSLEDLLLWNHNTVKLEKSQPITEEDPAAVSFNLQSREQAENGEYIPVEQIEISMGAAAIESGFLEIETDESSQPQKIEIVDGKITSRSGARAAGSEGGNNQLTVYLGDQIAVKKVTLVITRAKDGGSLAEISRVEFLNDMENRIPEPEMNIPGNLEVTPADKSFYLEWDQQWNITGYEVEISHGGETEIVRAASNSLQVKSFRGDKLKNKEVYEVRVRSVNGNWTSGFSGKKEAVPEVSKRPDAPDNVRAVGGYQKVRMSWKKMKDTDTYNVYYKEAGESAFRQVTGITQNQYEITGLKDQTRYEVYVTGVNEIGEGNPSIHSEARTITLKPAQMPEYKLINESNGKGKVSAHITGAWHFRGEMTASPLDTEPKSALGTVDKDFASSYQILDWDDGAVYVSPDKGLLFELDDYYKMSYIAFAETEDIASYGAVSVYYYDQEHPEGTYAENPTVVQRSDANGRKYYLIKLSKAITANKIRLGFSRGYNLRNMVIAEVNFYHYDSLEDDILGLYADDLHTSLKEGVTEETINELQQRLDTRDTKSGEYHPEKDVLQRELDNAKGLLASGFQDIIQINPKIRAGKDSHLGFGGLNSWQPLGITAYEGEQIVVYVGHNQLKTGSNSALKLIATQYHAESGAFASEVASLKVGRNEITIPAIQSLAFEGGGALYVQYTGNNDNDRYAVRVNGGVREPVLNLYGVSDAQERTQLVTSYVKELEEHVASQKSVHEQVHEAAGENSSVNRAYDKQNCILGATDIVLDQMMLSVSGEQILAGLGSGSSEERAERLDQSLYAMDEMLALFYQHKGLTREESAPATDRMPVQHLNIRYMRMFAGAFMYAAGNHIGIEWGSVPGLASSSPVISDERGRYQSGRYFGWGIAHEIGHNINQGAYAIAEVTNNYFALLAGVKDSNDSVRFKYENVYKKVTSGTVGSASNVFTQLAMYWQLHLAYDRDYNYKTYDSHSEQLANLFYARVDSYSRNTALAPGGLRLGGGSDQNIMRLACAAAEKDLTEFFMRWGMVPDADTIRYAGQFPKEERALYYLTDDARVYEMEYGVSGSVRESDVISAASSVALSEKVSNEVVLSIQNTLSNQEVILGYEIARYHYEDGKPVRQVIGFTPESSYVDHIYTVNNRVISYEVTAVDQFGYRSNPVRIGDVRISHDGSYDKSLWTVKTNMTSEADSAGTGQEEDPCDPGTESAIYSIVDHDYGNTYEGQNANGEAAILIHLNQVLGVCGLKYTLKSGTPVGDYEIQVSVDGKEWTSVRTGRFDDKKGSQTVYFENAAGDPWICTYDAAYVKLKAVGQSSMRISEIDLLGPSGDSISFGVKENSTEGAVGILKEDYVYEHKEGGERKVIPAGSLIFTGSYKGNPAYNVVVLYDEEGAVVGGVDEEGILKAEQIILAKTPENGLLGEVSDGIWIYWITPAEGQKPDIGKKVRAQLYRVDNALTNEGQRLVSDALPLPIPDELQEITLKSGVETQDGQ